MEIKILDLVEIQLGLNYRREFCLSMIKLFPDDNNEYWENKVKAIDQLLERFSVDSEEIKMI